MPTEKKKKPVRVKLGCRVTLSQNDSWQCQCGYVEEPCAYVAAHWHDTIDHTCPDCGRKHTFRSGVIWES